MVLWGLAGLGIADNRWPTPKAYWPYLAVKFMLFTMSSLTLQECWHTVLGTQLLLIARMTIAKRDSSVSEATSEQPDDKEDEGR